MKKQRRYNLTFLSHLTVIAFSILFILSANSCNKDEEEHEPELQILFQDNFSNNDQSWPIFNDTTAMGLIENGKYYLEHKINDPNYWYTIYLYKNLLGYYSIETSMSFIDGVEDFNYGVVWFRKDGYNHYFLHLQENKFQIGYLYNFNEHLILDWTQTESIKLNGEMNKIKIEVKYHSFNIFINNELIFEHDAMWVVGDEFGYKLQSKGEIAIDDLLIYKKL